MMTIVIILWILGAIGLTFAVIGLRFALRGRWWPCLLWFIIAAIFLALPVICQLDGMRIGRARTVQSDQERAQMNEFNEESP
jgi:hypothetical protein